MIQQVSDTASNRKDQIANFAEILRNAPARQKIFEAVYRGKKRGKTVLEVSDATPPFSTKRVTMIGKSLVREKLFEQSRERIDGRVQTVYNKIEFVASNKQKILSLARNRKSLESYPTKSNPNGARSSVVKIRVPFTVKVKFVTIDDVNQFWKVKKVKNLPNALAPKRLSERAVKRGILRLLQELKLPKDWGGETNDIFTAKLKISGRRRRAAFALKGPAKTGVLVPAKMGKNGDQIQRLLSSPADTFFVQYEGEIAESVTTLMEQLAKARAILGGEVAFGIIDRDDTYRLRIAYPKFFLSGNS